MGKRNGIGNQSGREKNHNELVDNFYRQGLRDVPRFVWLS